MLCNLKNQKYKFSTGVFNNIINKNEEKSIVCRSVLVKANDHTVEL